MSHPSADIFRAAAACNADEKHRIGNVVEFAPGEHLIVCGDIHGHRNNLAKTIAYADLAGSPQSMLLLQEIIHGGPDDGGRGDRSFELLLRVARLKCRFTEQVHFLMANHDLAQLTDNEITKNDQGSCKAFDIGLRNAFGDAADEVADAIDEFIRSQPLAGRCPNGVFVSHSLPSPQRAKMFDVGILRRPYQQQDFKRGHSVYELTWGRRHTEALLDDMAERLGAELFINGHQPLEGGFLVNGRQLLVTSDHTRGAIAEFDVDQALTRDDLPRLVKRISKL